MGRQIIKKDQAPKGVNDTKGIANYDDYQGRINKLIPGDIVGVYLCAICLVRASNVSNPDIYKWAIFGLVLLVCPFYLYRVAKILDKKQITLIVVAFLIWSISLGDPFTSLDIFLKISTQLIGSILVVIFTLAAPLIYSSNTGNS